MIARIRILQAVLLLVLFSTLVFSQQPVASPAFLQPEIVRQDVALPGCQVLRPEHAKLQQYLQEHPEALEEVRLMKRTAWNFQVGDKGPIQSTGWWATNLTTNSEYLVPSTCRAVGTNSYIFVEDSLWNNGRVDQTVVDSIRTAWDLRTPANANKGIYQTGVETFGNPPNVDNDPRIIILILDIKDGYAGSGSYVAGYFFGINQFPDGSPGAGGHRSNYAEIYYLDGNPLNLKTSSGLTLGMQTTAHEFQHMIHWNYDSNEMTFINEACSQVAELVCGYPYLDQSRYTDNTDVYLLGWSGSLADYSRATRWMLYIWNQFPNNYLRMLVAEPANGIAGMNNAFALYGTTRRFDDVFLDWLIANEVNNTAVNPRYGYTYTGNLTKPRATVYQNPNTGTQNGSVDRLAADYITFAAGANLSVTFTSSSSFLTVKAIKVGPGGTQIVDVSLNAQYSEPGFGTTFTRITFVVINPSQNSTATYSYEGVGGSSTVSVELKWDQTEPVGRLLLGPLDTLCVIFDAVPGGRLDSVRVALRRAGTMNGGVWTYTGVSRPTPLGRPLAKPISVSTTLTPPVINPTATYPYETPYPNWRTIDLRSYGILTDQRFAVGFWMSADTSQDAGVMVTKHSSGEFYNSLTYSTGTGGRNWYYFTSAGDGLTFLYLIRAYVTVGGVVAAPAVPTLFAPENGAINLSLRPTLSWNASARAVAYRLQVAVGAPDSTRLIVDEVDLAETSVQIGPLQPKTKYFWRVSARNAIGSSPFSNWFSFTTVPNTFALLQNYPNPFNPGTTISYDLAEKSSVKLQIYDVLGRLVRTLVDAQQEAGSYSVTWDGRGEDRSSAGSGVYFYTLDTGSQVMIRKMLLLR